MKNLIWITLAFLSSASYAQQKKDKKNDMPPIAVSGAFHKAFTGSSNVKWEKEKGGYEVAFVQNGKEMSAVYDAKAALLETETVMKTSELPAAAQDYVRKNYKSAVIREAAKIVNAKGDVMYEVEINKKDLMFDSNGKFLKIQAE